MLQKKYADTDFFLALMKESDWLREKARKVYLENKDTVYVTQFTIAELMLICKRENIPLKQTIVQISRMVILENGSWDIFLRASDFIEKGATVFDSLLMASCAEGDQIISSDNVYAKFGFEVIDLKK